MAQCNFNNEWSIWGITKEPPTPYSPIKIAEAVKKVIIEKIFEYGNQTLCNPHYIKMPMWIFLIIKQVNNGKFLKKIESEEYEFIGLKVCPTHAIFDISQIEVF